MVLLFGTNCRTCNVISMWPEILSHFFCCTSAVKVCAATTNSFGGGIATMLACLLAVLVLRADLHIGLQVMSVQNTQPKQGSDGNEGSEYPGSPPGNGHKREFHEGAPCGPCTVWTMSGCDERVRGKMPPPKTMHIYTGQSIN
jgi:hypothetical protein